jgi:hypothetical protein
MKERQKKFFLILVPATLLVILIVFLGYFEVGFGRDRYLKKEIQYLGNCSQSWDFWSRLNRIEKSQACTGELYYHVVDLGKLGFSPGDCRPKAVEVISCEPMLGHQLLCTYFCKKKIE